MTTKTQQKRDGERIERSTTTWGSVRTMWSSLGGTRSSSCSTSAKFIIFNEQFLVFNTQFLVFNAQFLVLNSKIHRVYSRSHERLARPGCSTVSQKLFQMWSKISPKLVQKLAESEPKVSNLRRVPKVAPLATLALMAPQKTARSEWNTSKELRKWFFTRKWRSFKVTFESGALCVAVLHVGAAGLQTEKHY